MYPDVTLLSRRLLRGNYERVSQRLLRGQPKAKPFGKLVGNKFITGTQSLHLTPQSRRWRMFWRMKNRKLKSI